MGTAGSPLLSSHISHYDWLSSDSWRCEMYVLSGFPVHVAATGNVFCGHKVLPVLLHELSFIRPVVNAHASTHRRTVSWRENVGICHKTTTRREEKLSCETDTDFLSSCYSLSDLQKEELRHLTGITGLVCSLFQEPLRNTRISCYDKESSTGSVQIKDASNHC